MSDIGHTAQKGWIIHNGSSHYKILINPGNPAAMTKNCVRPVALRLLLSQNLPLQLSYHNTIGIGKIVNRDCDESMEKFNFPSLHKRFLLIVLYK
jgi:hypothetical protein